jgi:hypothetical protein
VLTLEGSGRTAQRFVNGRTAPGTLAPRRRRLLVEAGASRTIAIRIPALVVRRARHGLLMFKVSFVPDVAGAFTGVRRAVRVRVGSRR